MGRFETTRWSVVLRARGEPADARGALDTLCRTYRPPVLAFVQSRGYPRDAAEDLTQAFFAKLLERAWHARADPARGRFRTFLLTALKRFLIDQRIEAGAQKRGGGIRFEEFDESAASGGVERESPEDAFQREWARAVLQVSLARLRAEAAHAGKLGLFERLAEFLVEQPDPADYPRVAAELEMRPNTLAVAVHRLRHRLRELVRAELMETTASEADLAVELRALRASLTAGSS